MIEYYDRYSALGIPEPDPQTMCHGDCEGTGWVPIYNDMYFGGVVYAVAEKRIEEKYLESWNAAHKTAGEHPCDGWHFIKCLDCQGTGKQPAASQQL